MKTYYFITLYPKALEAYCSTGIFRRAAEEQKAVTKCIFLRDFAVDHHGSVDDKPYGGGPGMVMRPEPLAAAVRFIKEKDPQACVVFTDPKAEVWTQQKAQELATDDRSLIFICGRFEGVDQRFINKYVDRSFSLGSFVISGGELAALAMTESMLRLQILDQESLQDSFSSHFEGGLEYPQYTRPEVFEGEPVPNVLLSGDHAKIANWRKNQIQKT